jgi:hypothetical protein
VIRPSFFFALSLLGGASVEAAPVKIELKYPQGRVLLFKSEQNNITDAAGMRIIQVHVQEIEEEVLSTEGGQTHLRMTYMRQAMRTESPMGSMSFDSASDSGPISDPSFAVLGALVGQSFEVLLNGDHSVREVRGAEDIAQHIRDAMPSDMPSASVDQVVASFNPDALGKMVSENTQILPAEPVEIGASWTRIVEMDLPGVGEMTTTSNYTLSKVSGRLATIDFVVSAQMEAGNALFTGLNLTGKGLSHFDLDRGFLVDSHVSIKMTGEIQGMPMTVTSQVDVEQSLK